MFRKLKLWVVFSGVIPYHAPPPPTLLLLVSVSIILETSAKHANIYCSVHSLYTQSALHNKVMASQFIDRSKSNL